MASYTATTYPRRNAGVPGFPQQVTPHAAAAAGCCNTCRQNPCCCKMDCCTPCCKQICKWILLGLLLTVGLLALLFALGAYMQAKDTHWLLTDGSVNCTERSCDHGCSPPVQSLPGIDCCDTVFFDDYRNVTGVWQPTQVYPAELPEEFYEIFSIPDGMGSMTMNPGIVYAINDTTTTQGDSIVHADSTPFTNTIAPGMFGPGTGLLDVLKAAIMVRGAIRVAKDETLIVEFTVSANVTIGEPPFRLSVMPNPNDDPRLAVNGPIIYDPVTGLTGCFFFTREAIWGMHDRLSLADPTVTVWGSGTRLAPYTPGEKVCLRIIYDRSANCITWYVNGVEKKKICNLGTLPPADQRTLWVNRGGEPKPANPSSFMISYLSGHFLDAKLEGAGDKGLIMLDPAIPYVEPTQWALQNTEETRLFGQGADLWVCRVRAYKCSC